MLTMADNPPFTAQGMSVEDVAATALRHQLEKIGPSVSVDRFLRGYGNSHAKAACAGRLAAFLVWLKAE